MINVQRRAVADWLRKFGTLGNLRKFGCLRSQEATFIKVRESKTLDQPDFTIYGALFEHVKHDICMLF